MYTYAHMYTCTHMHTCTHVHISTRTHIYHTIMQHTTQQLSNLAEVQVIFRSCETILASLTWPQACKQLVEDMVVSLPSGQSHYTRLLQQELWELGTSDQTPRLRHYQLLMNSNKTQLSSLLSVKVYLQILPKATGVVVLHSFSIPKGFQQGCGLKDLLVLWWG